MEAWMSLGPDAWITLSVIFIVFTALMATAIDTDIVLTGAVTILLVSGILTAKEALAGLSNEGIVTIAVLYVVVAGLDATGANNIMAERFLSRPKSVTGALMKMMFPVTFVSAFMNNTPVVAMFLPTVNDWAKQHRIAVSKPRRPGPTGKGPGPSGDVRDGSYDNPAAGCTRMPHSAASRPQPNSGHHRREAARRRRLGD